MFFSFLASVVEMLLQTGGVYSSLGLTEVQCNNNKQSIVTVFCGVKGYHLCQGIALCHDSGKKRREKIMYSHPITVLDRRRSFQEVDAPRFLDTQHMKAVRLSVLRTG
jgi:hypothetical protein